MSGYIVLNSITSTRSSLSLPDTINDDTSYCIYTYCITDTNKGHNIDFQYPHLFLKIESFFQKILGSIQ